MVAIVLVVIFIIFALAIYYNFFVPWKKDRLEKVTNESGNKIFYRVIWSKKGKTSKYDLEFWDLEDAKWYYEVSRLPAEFSYSFGSDSYWNIWIYDDYQEFHIQNPSKEEKLTLREQVKQKTWTVETIH